MMPVLALFAVLGSDWAADIQARLVHPSLVRGTFTQEKQLQGFKHPVVSQGHFVLAQGHGILWDTDKPFPSHVTITHERIVSSRADGSTAMQVDSNHAPLFAINEILFALLAGDVSVLQKRFTVQGKSGATWQLDLQATDPGVAKAVQRVHLEGDRYVQQIELQEASGDHSTIRLTGISTAPPLSADEAHRLE